MPTTKFILELDGENADAAIEALVKMISESVPELAKKDIAPTFMVAFRGDNSKFDVLKEGILREAKRKGIEIHSDINGGMESYREANTGKPSKTTVDPDDPFLKKLQKMFDV